MEEKKLVVNYWGSVHYNYETLCLDATIYRSRAILVSIIGRTISWWDDDLSMIGNILSGDSRKAQFAKLFVFLDVCPSIAFEWKTMCIMLAISLHSFRSIRVCNDF